ncbi:MAG: DUF4351 domain-containing protein [Castellaniella sp.]|uniref:DUF4351 domain-containing protein n=1 Tax=Castellaniella sp. TaxID=1955812 RepID=UPI003C774D7E
MSARKRSTPVPAPPPSRDRKSKSRPKSGLNMDASSIRTKAVQSDYDSTWKEILELLFPEAIKLLAPDLHALIDWNEPIEFMDKELQAVLRASAPARGRRHADKLARVSLLAGETALLLVHVEVEGRLSGALDLQIFSWRILEYNVLFRHRERRKGKALLPPQVYSLGMLIDQPSRRDGTPHAVSLTYENDFLVQQTRFTFPIVELESWRSRWDELDALAPTNPFAVIIMAQLQASGHPDKATRLAPLLDLTRRLYGYGYKKEQIGPLLRWVESIVRLPTVLEAEYLPLAKALEQEHEMSYVTIAERHGLARGHVKGLAEGRIEGEANLLLRLIKRRFGNVGVEITQRIQSASAQDLETWSLNILDATTLEDVFRD